MYDLFDVVDFIDDGSFGDHIDHVARMILQTWKDKLIYLLVLHYEVGQHWSHILHDIHRHREIQYPGNQSVLSFQNDILFLLINFLDHLVIFLANLVELRLQQIVHIIDFYGFTWRLDALSKLYSFLHQKFQFSLSPWFRVILILRLQSLYLRMDFNLFAWLFNQGHKILGFVGLLQRELISRIATLWEAVIAPRKQLWLGADRSEVTRASWRKLWPQVVLWIFFYLFKPGFMMCNLPERLLLRVDSVAESVNDSVFQTNR